MKLTIHRWGVVLTGVFIALASQGNADEPKEKPKGNRYALLVGVSQYDPTELNNLKYPEDDVTALAKVLEEAGYVKENIMLMTQTVGAKNARSLPLAANIQAELDLLLKGRAKDDVVLIAFAGHGVQFHGEEESFFCPLGTKLGDRKTLVSLANISKSLEGCPAGLKLLLVDACRNDPQAANSRSRAEVKLNSVTRPPQEPPTGGVAAYYSCSERQKAYEDPELKHGVFFHFVIAGLQGGAVRDSGGDIYLGDLQLYVNDGVERFVRSKLGQSQLPQLLTKISGSQKPLVSYPKAKTPTDQSAKQSFEGIDQRYVPGSIGPTERVNLPTYSSKDHKIKRLTVLRQITNHRPAQSAELYPELISMSANGEKIAWFAPQKGIYTANWDGSNEKLAVPNKPNASTPVAHRFFMSPDGYHVFWQHHSGPLMRVNSDGTDLRVLVKEAAEFGLPRLRDWGRRIFYGSRAGIYSIDTEGVGDLQSLLTQKDLFNVFNVQGILLGEFDVSERGTELACRIYDPDLKRHQLYVMPVGGDPVKDLRILVKTAFEPTMIYVSPNGRQVFFGEYGKKCYIVNWDGTGMQELDIPTPDPNQLFRFSPDGRWISYFASYGGSVLVKLDGSDRVEPYHTGQWHGHKMAIFHSASPVVFSKDFRRFLYVMNYYSAGEGPRQLVVGEINPAKVSGVPELTEIAFPKRLSKDPALPNHVGTISAKIKKGELADGPRDVERVQFVLTPYMVRPDKATVWNMESGWFSLFGDHQLNDEGKNGDEKAGDGIWTSAQLQPNVYFATQPGKYALRITAHDKTTLRGWEKANAVIVDVDGLEIK